jgi:hypothetical protein
MVHACAREPRGEDASIACCAVYPVDIAPVVSVRFGSLGFIGLGGATSTVL